MTADQRFANIDERIAFLVQSTESLHVTAMEQTAQIAAQGLQIAEHTKQLAIDAEHIRALVRIAEIHEQRLSGLEEPPSRMMHVNSTLKTVQTPPTPDKPHFP